MMRILISIESKFSFSISNFVEGDILKDKKEIRKKILDLRKKLLKEQVLKKSKAITQKIITLNQFLESKNIMVYMNFSKEVSTKLLIEKCFEKNKRVLLPLANLKSEKSKLEVYEVTDIENQVGKSKYGILEPKKELTQRIDAKEIDMVVVPGVVFDENRNRIGYGAGCYDSFLRETRKECYKTGIAFELQICYHIPIEEHDVPLDMIVTEKRII
ncbi:5-formyltetrahydrofolate cyclo-ligase [Herbivorax sp. ANBcel31]|uniref:5-formyltetrahydrofolate cyclo-ligase n=1 Tax=Herbivorax sp. ANBcel31 TaxID=3069754 RepID=UPI0027B2289F|nr:5-formyltetrahydrofolate cyclo-ligase [Herbivorax sp. ANBcel31]MDQ2085011.1 5-formyltetrahydrofolate cyclo-ligase [Herbivorax sp. ANBcel31]